MDENSATAAPRLHRPGESRELTSSHPELAFANLVVVFEKATRRRPRGARAIFVVDPAVTRAHEQTRLREPAHWAAEVRAVDREDLEPVTLRSEEHTSELQSPYDLVCRLLLEKKN